MGEDYRRLDCCEQECKDRCVKECYCKEQNGNNGILLILLIIVLFCIFCNDDNNGGLFGGLF